MEKKILVDRLDRMIAYLLLAVIFFIPLFFNRYTFLIFEVDKIVLFRILVEIMVCSHLIKIIASEEFALPKAKTFFFALSPLVLAQILSTVFSDHPLVSFWGSYWREWGLFTMIHLFLFAFLAYLYIGHKGLSLKRVLYAMSLSGFVVSVYAAAQSAGYDFLTWQNAADGFQARATSTLGQPNYLGGFLLLVLPVTVYLLINAKNFKEKAWWLAIGGVQFWALVVSYSRAAWLGLLLASVSFGLRRLYKKSRLIFGGIFIALIIAGGSYLWLSFARPVEVLPDNNSMSISYRLRTLANVYQGSSILRIFYYDAAIKIIKGAPILGHGLDTQIFYFYKYYQPNYALYEAINQYPDRAHNEILDILLTTGLIGLAAWLWLFFKIYKTTFDFLSAADNDKKILVELLFWGTAGLVFSLMFGFFSVVMAVYFWLVIALLFKITAISQEQEMWKSRVVLNQPAKILFCIVLFSISLFFVWQYNLKAVIANSYYKQVRISAYLGKYNELFENFNKVLEYAPEAAKETYYNTQFIAELLPSVNSLPLKQQERMLNYLQDVLSQQRPEDYTFEYQLNSALLLSRKVALKIAQGQDTQAESRQIEESFHEMVKETPGFPHLYFDWGNLYFFQGQYDQALSKYFQALSSYPSLYHPDLNQEHRELNAAEMLRIYKQIIGIELLQKHYGTAIKFCHKAIRIAPFDLVIRNQLISAYQAQGLFKQSVVELEHLLTIYPYDSELYYQLAKAYRHLKDEAMAKRNIEAALKLDDNEKYKAFLKNNKTSSTSTGSIYLNFNN